MSTRPIYAAIAVVAVTVGITAARILPASSGPDPFRAPDVAAVVALLHHDQQGVVLAHQAGAQSPTPATRARAAALADAFQRQARALTALLDTHRVPVGRRLVDTTRIGVVDDGAVGCDLMPKDAVSNLAAAAPADFDTTFSTLMDRHLVGGVRMTEAVLDSSGLSRSQRASVRRPQRALA